MPFDRLVRTVDEWAGQNRSEEVFAQIGETSWRPRFIEFARWLAPAEYREKVKACSAMVSHAGMGSIITALEFGKPILVMPRRGDLGETRNDHQAATARRFQEREGVAVAFDEHELGQKLSMIQDLSIGMTVSPWASPKLLSTIEQFVAASAAEIRSSKAFGPDGGVNR